LLAVGALAGAAAYALVGSRSPSALNNAMFAGLHIVIQLVGVSAALRPRRRPQRAVATAPLRAWNRHEQAPA
jgi:hypothetical protein